MRRFGLHRIIAGCGMPPRFATRWHARFRLARVCRPAGRSHERHRGWRLLCQLSGNGSCWPAGGGRQCLLNRCVVPRHPGQHLGLSVRLRPAGGTCGTSDGANHRGWRSAWRRFVARHTGAHVRHRRSIPAAAGHPNLCVRLTCRPCTAPHRSGGATGVLPCNS